LHTKHFPSFWSHSLLLHRSGHRSEQLELKKPGLQEQFPNILPQASLQPNEQLVPHWCPKYPFLHLKHSPVRGLHSLSLHNSEHDWLQDLPKTPLGQVQPTPSDVHVLLQFSPEVPFVHSIKTKKNQIKIYK
jgi:hypothetical protein